MPPCCGFEKIIATPLDNNWFTMLMSNHGFYGRNSFQEANYNASVAQMVSASPCHGEGRGFKSRQRRKARYYDGLTM